MFQLLHAFTYNINFFNNILAERMSGRHLITRLEVQTPPIQLLLLLQLLLWLLLLPLLPLLQPLYYYYYLYFCCYYCCSVAERMKPRSPPHLAFRKMFRLLSVFIHTHAWLVDWLHLWQCTHTQCPPAQWQLERLELIKIMSKAIVSSYFLLTVFYR